MKTEKRSKKERKKAGGQEVRKEGRDIGEGRENFN